MGLEINTLQKIPVSSGDFLFGRKSSFALLIFEDQEQTHIQRYEFPNGKIYFPCVLIEGKELKYPPPFIQE